MANIEIMKNIELTEEHVRQAFKEAKSDEAKKTLTALFPDIVKELTKKKPTLDDYTSITSYEDACAALGEPPILSKDYVRSLGDTKGEMEFYIYGCEKANTEWETLVCRLPGHIIALMKLEVISRALWGRNWRPQPDLKGSKRFFWPWFYLYPNEEIGRTYAHADNVCPLDMKFGNMYVSNMSSYAIADFGFLLCQETSEKATYFGGKNFINLWAEYLRFDLGECF